MPTSSGQDIEFAVSKVTSDPADVLRFGPSALDLAEGHVLGKLDCQAGHGPGGQGLDFGYSSDQSSFGAVSL